VKIAKNCGKARASNYGFKDHYKIYKTRRLALMTVITCSAVFMCYIFENDELLNNPIDYL